MRALADTIDSVLHRKVDRKLATVEELEAELAKDPSNNMKKYRVG
jgi:hypothetical protein